MREVDFQIFLVLAQILSLKNGDENFEYFAKLRLSQGWYPDKTIYEKIPLCMQ